MATRPLTFRKSLVFNPYSHWMEFSLGVSDGVSPTGMEDLVERAVNFRQKYDVSPRLERGRFVKAPPSKFARQAILSKEVSKIRGILLRMQNPEVNFSVIRGLIERLGEIGTEEAAQVLADFLKTSIIIVNPLGTPFYRIDAFQEAIRTLMKMKVNEALKIAVCKNLLARHEGELPILARQHLNEVAPEEVDAFDDRESLQFFNTLSQSESNSPENLYFLGFAYYINGEEIKAIEKLERAVRLRPSYDAAHFLLAILYIERGDRKKAKEHYKKISPRFEIPFGDRLRMGML